MITTNIETPACVLAIGAHPDDIEFGAAATLSRWAAAGADVHLLVLTDGSKGTWDGSANIAELVATRQREQLEAADRIGASHVHNGTGVDGELDAGREEQAFVCEVIRAVRPAVVLGHDPWRRHRVHPDHEAAGRLLVAGVVAARDPHFFAGLGGQPHRPAAVLLFETDTINHVELVEARHMTTKREALIAHRSQWHSTMGIHTDPEAESIRFGRRITITARAHASRTGGSFGEGFLRVDSF